MTVYYSSNKFINNAAGQNTVQPVYNATGSAEQVGTFAQTVALVAGDTVHMVTVPPYVTVTNVQLDIDAMDSSTGFTCQVGDATNGAGAWIATAAFGQSSAGSVQGANVPGFLGYAQFTVATDIVVKCIHAATTALLTGSIRLKVSWTAVP